MNEIVKPQKSLEEKDATQLKYNVHLDLNSKVPKIEYADIKVFKGDKEVDSFAGLSRDELGKAVGKNNLFNIESGRGENKDSHVSEQGRLMFYAGKLEKENLVAQEIATNAVSEKRVTNKELSNLVFIDPDTLKTKAQEAAAASSKANVAVQEASNAPQPTDKASGSDLSAPEHEKRFIVDGKEANQVKYTVKMEANSVDASIESADVKIYKGRKEIAAFANLDRSELEKVVGAKNVDNIENGMGANKRGQVKDDVGRAVEFSGKLEKENLAPETTTTVGVEHKKTFQENNIVDHLQAVANDEPTQAKDNKTYLVAHGQDKEKENTYFATTRDSSGKEETHYMSQRNIDDLIKEHEKAGTLKLDNEKAAAKDNEPGVINSIEPNFEKERANTSAFDDEVKQNAARNWANRNKQADRVDQNQPVIVNEPSQDSGRDNQIVDEDVFVGTSDKKIVTTAENVPKDIEDNYLKVGKRYHYQNKPDLIAFEDKGDKLETVSNSEKVAADLVRIAHARGWEDIRAKGNEDFRRQVWLEGNAKGMEVKGYSPSEADKALLEKRLRELPTNSVEKDKQHEKATTPQPAPTKIHPEAAKPSVLHSEADKRAAEQKAAEKEEQRKQALDAANKAKKEAQEKADALRNENQKDAVKKYPDLISAFAMIRAAEILAKEQFKNPDDRKNFVDTTRETLAKQIEQSKTLPPVAIKEREVTKEQTRDASISL